LTLRDGNSDDINSKLPSILIQVKSKPKD
jgi:hypothetical protein